MKYFVVMKKVGEYSEREVKPVLVLKDEMVAQQKVEELTKKNEEDLKVWWEGEGENAYLEYPGKKSFYTEAVEGEE